MATCTSCQHSKAAHELYGDGTTEPEMLHCNLCPCEVEYVPEAVSIREAARRYAVERGCGRETLVDQLTADELHLLKNALSEAHVTRTGLTAYERIDKRVQVERLAKKLGVEL